MKFDCMIERELKEMNYKLIFEQCDYALIIRGNDLKEYAVVNGLNKEDSSWAWTVAYADFRSGDNQQLRAFQSCYEVFMAKVIKGYIPRFRLEELATQFKDGLLEDGYDDAMEYFTETLEMSDSELEYFGLCEEDSCRYQLVRYRAGEQKIKEYDSLEDLLLCIHIPYVSVMELKDIIKKEIDINGKWFSPNPSVPLYIQKSQRVDL